MVIYCLSILKGNVGNEYVPDVLLKFQQSYNQ